MIKPFETEFPDRRLGVGTCEADRISGDGGVPETLRYKRILVPVDFSVCTAQTLQYACALARQFHGNVHLLHLIHLHIAGEDRGIPRTSLIRQMSDAARNALQKVVGVLWNGEVPAMIVIREGRPHEAILTEARQTNADLIVMGTSGRSGFLSLFRRTTTARVIRRASCPVLVVPIVKRNLFAGSRSKLTPHFGLTHAN